MSSPSKLAFSNAGWLEPARHLATSQTPAKDGGIAYYAEVPSTSEHYRLRFEAGLTPPPKAEVAAIGLRSSVYCVVARDTSTPRNDAVGMARIVGDITLSLLIVDVCVLPTYQHRGIGHRIFAHLLEWVDRHSPSAFLSLSADPPGVKLYEKNGFVITPNETAMQRLGQDIVDRRQLAKELRAKGASQEENPIL